MGDLWVLSWLSKVGLVNMLGPGQVLLSNLWVLSWLSKVDLATKVCAAE